MKTIGVIPARWASTRLPGKALVPICGKPLIQWVVERVLEAKRLDEVVVATDDRRILDTAQGLGVRAVMTRADHPSGTDRVAEAVEGAGADIVVNIQGDEPLIDPGLLDRLAARMASDPGWDMGTAAVPLTDPADIRKPSVVKVVRDATGRALYFSRAVIPHVRDPAETDPAGLYWRHVGVYVYRAAFLQRLVRTPPCALELAEKLEQLRALHLGGRLFVEEAAEAGIGVDTPEDVAYVEALIRRRHGT